MSWLDVSRQLEHSSNRHMSPAGSEDVRMGSETEADRHFRWVDGGIHPKIRWNKAEISFTSESDNVMNNCSALWEEFNRNVYL